MIGRKKKKRNRVKRLGFVGGAAAAGMYFFDPRMGRTRRARFVDQVRAFLRRGTKDLEGKATYVGERAYGAAREVIPDTPPPDDETLKDKIESEVLRHDRWPKGDLNVDVLNGVVTLRGELDDEQRVELEQRVRKVTGVMEVHNLIHPPMTDAPNKADALEASRRAEEGPKP